MAILRPALCVVILLAATASRGAGQVLAGPEGPVEFVGLEHWSASELLEAIRQITPDQPLHACAAVMKGQLGFADAAVRGYVDSHGSLGSERYTVIIGVKDRARVRYRTAGSGTIDLPESWQALKSVAEKNLGVLSMASPVSLDMALDYFEFSLLAVPRFRGRRKNVPSQPSESPAKLEAAMCDFARAPKRPMGPRGSHDQGSG